MKHPTFLSIYLTVLLVPMSGCYSYISKQREVYIEPSSRRVILFNDTTNFILKETGIFNESLHPGGRAETNVDCLGRVEGLVDAYIIVGHDKGGNNILQWYGQRKYRLYVDAKNEVMRGVSLDDYQIFTDVSFYPGGKREYWGASINPCSGPGVIIEFGR